MKIKNVFLLLVIGASLILSNALFSSCASRKKLLNTDASELNSLQDTYDSEEDDDVFVNYHRGPEFLGGGSVTEWIHSRLRYPLIAQENGIYGKVYIQFMIEDDGSVTNVKVMRGVDAPLDKEAVRIVQSMPKWKPAAIWNPEIHEFKAVRSSFSMPINFSLDSIRNKVVEKHVVDSIPESEFISFSFIRSPEFTGGGTVKEWVYSRLRYPVEAQIAKIEGRVGIQFVIEDDGSVTNVKVMRGVDKYLDNEAIRVIELMPKWKPSTQKNKAVRCYYSMPVHFSLDSIKNKVVDKHIVDSILEDRKVFFVVDEYPEFFKGNLNLRKWIQSKTAFKPVDGSYSRQIIGRVYAKFIIEKDGSISNIEIFRSPDKFLSEEAIKIIKSMPKWKPGRNKGKPVRVSFSMPISFDLF